MTQSLGQIVKKLKYLQSAKKTSTGKGGSGVIKFKSVDGKWPSKELAALLPRHKKSLTGGAPLLRVDGAKGPLWFLQGKDLEQKNHYGYFSPSPYAMARDMVAGVFRQALAAKLKSVKVEYIGENEEEFLGLCVGLEMTSYKFSRLWPESSSQLPQLVVKSGFKNHGKLVAEAQAVGSGANLARFLVDLPPNALNPTSYEKLAMETFKGLKGVRCSVWNHKRLLKEGMGLHLAVGQASETPPCLIHIEYRSPGLKDAPLAFVGKGITFDSGGLDIKPPSGMRLMKKDMGGSATVMGLAHWVAQARPKVNCDFYLAVAENAIGGNAFRPSDIITAKNGKTVEIHNTDAEGRLVLADTLTIASRKKPKLIVDVATLTGAIKYGLGSDTPGLFSNDDSLAEILMSSSQKRGETAWRMPLVPGEKSRLRSEVADMVNCTDGFGGAITAALFLESFVEGVPWAHFDIYGWTGKTSGVFRHTGGNGQLVQALADFVMTQAK